MAANYGQAYRKARASRRPASRYRRGGNTNMTDGSTSRPPNTGAQQQAGRRDRQNYQARPAQAQPGQQPAYTGQGTYAPGPGMTAGPNTGVPAGAMSRVPAEPRFRPFYATQGAARQTRRPGAYDDLRPGMYNVPQTDNPSALNGMQRQPTAQWALDPRSGQMRPVGITPIPFWDQLQVQGPPAPYVETPYPEENYGYGGGGYGGYGYGGGGYGGGGYSYSPQQTSSYQGQNRPKSTYGQTKQIDNWLYSLTSWNIGR